MANLLFLVGGSSINLPIPQVSLGSQVFQLIPAIFFIGGFLFVKDAGGDFAKEIAGVILMGIALVIPVSIDANTVNTVLIGLETRWPIMALALGLGFIMDKGWKILPGLVLCLGALGGAGFNVLH